MIYQPGFYYAMPKPKRIKPRKRRKPKPVFQAGTSVSYKDMKKAYREAKPFVKAGYRATKPVVIAGYNAAKPLARAGYETAKQGFGRIKQAYITRRDATAPMQRPKHLYEEKKSLLSRILRR
jgi:hypothetical protein